MSILLLLWELVREFFMGTEEEQAEMQLWANLPNTTFGGGSETVKLLASSTTQPEEARPCSTNAPTPQANPWLWHQACKGCANWHGVRYGNELLVCAMHPFGVDAEWCKDWEKPQLEEPFE